jgi:hypothetical protein
LLSDGSLAALWRLSGGSLAALWRLPLSRYLGDRRHLFDAFKHNEEWALAMMLLHEVSNGSLTAL